MENFYRPGSGSLRRICRRNNPGPCQNGFREISTAGYSAKLGMRYPTDGRRIFRKILYRFVSRTKADGKICGNFYGKNNGKFRNDSPIATSNP